MIMKTFEDLTISEIEVLSQAHTRLLAEGFISIRHSFGDFLDVVVARGEYSGTQADDAVREMVYEND